VVIAADAVAALIAVALVLSLYSLLFAWQAVWFVPYALLPRGFAAWLIRASAAKVRALQRRAAERIRRP